MTTGIARAREELFAAHLLSTTGFAAQTVGLCFRAAQGAAEAALMLLERPIAPEPAAVVAAFVRHVVRERGLAPEVGRLLRSLYNRHLQAEADGAVPQPEAPRALADATAVIDAVSTWIEISRRVAGGARPHPPPGPPLPLTHRPCTPLVGAPMSSAVIHRDTVALISASASRVRPRDRDRPRTRTRIPALTCGPHRS